VYYYSCQAYAHNLAQETPAPAEPAVSEPTAPANVLEDGANSNSAPNGDVPAVSAAVEENFDFNFAEFTDFQNVFKRFQETQEDASTRHEDKEQIIWEEDNDNIPDEEAENLVARKSKKQRKRENKLSVAELKAMARKPELVEWTDADSSDPRLLLAIKSHRNIVPVPAHWSLKREVCSIYCICGL
jgi:splicing factor 3B subunit 2